MIAIDLQNVSVRHRREKIRSLKELAVHGFSRRDRESFYSLRDVSLQITSGEAVGIVGPNGAGKSTLLRVASGIITPSDGVVTARGNVVPLLELGTGFEAEFSGRENIFFNGALLGRSRNSIQSQLDAIIDFSGLAPFIDAPLRTYSTGMVARLAFAIATSIDAETILLDEILAVGDAAFRERCEERIHSFVREGRTVVVVSHELPELSKLCRRVVWLDHGGIVRDGGAAETLEAYEHSRATA